MIKVENLSKRFGRIKAVDNVSFEVGRGEIVGFLGPNGAGKTTTMRILSCFMPATGGQVTIDGLDVFTQSLAVRRKIGYMPEQAPLYPDMRVVEYLRYRGGLKGLRGRRLRRRVDDVLVRCGLVGVERRVIAQLSKGYRKRLGLADSLVNEPELLILDEPTIGLDPHQIRHIRELIKGLAHRQTVLLSSHILSEVEMICERVLIINKGQIVASDTTENLVSIKDGGLQVVAEIRGERNRIVEKLETIPGIGAIACEERGAWQRITCDCAPGGNVREEIFRVISANGWMLRELREERGSLEDVFMDLVSGTKTTVQGDGG
jgi:ABC-2 type transport system ATP-binding protein